MGPTEQFRLYQDRRGDLEAREAAEKIIDEIEAEQRTAREKARRWQAAPT